MYRSSSFDEYLSQKLHDANYAQAYLFQLVNDEESPLEIEAAIRELINIMGVTEFSNLIGESKSNVGNFLNGKRKLKQETLNKYLAPFKLKIKLILEQAA
jgi:antitoxin component HigA of HigAB toxin-antitoxin module